jgi:hypothetical protein
VNERQNNMERGSASTSVKIDDPVVLKPDADSKKASKNPGISPEIMNGAAPTADAVNQLTATIKKPSRPLNL